MLGLTTLAQTPFAALADRVVFSRLVVGSAAGSATLTTKAGFATSVLGSADALDALTATGIYDVYITEAVSGVDSVEVGVSSFSAPIVEGIATGRSLTFAGGSEYNTSVVEAAFGLDEILANAAYIAAISDGALGVDEIMARLLWEVINDSQNANWQNISDAQTTTWSVVKTQS